MLINLYILRVPAKDVPIPAVYGNEVSGIKLRRVIPDLSVDCSTGSGSGSG